MSSFEFGISQNMTGQEGTIEGYFSVTERDGFNGIAITNCILAVEMSENRKANACIPIIHDEFGSGMILKRILTQNSEHIPGFVTFGTDTDQMLMLKRPESHLAIISRDIGMERSFLAPLCTVPNKLSNLDWREESPLLDLYLRFGSVTVKDNVCTITVDHSVPPLKSQRD